MMPQRRPKGAHRMPKGCPKESYLGVSYGEINSNMLLNLFKASISKYTYLPTSKSPEVPKSTK